MHAELPVLSFLPVLLFMLVLPGQLKSTSIPAISIFSWLIICNIIHGTNSILWAGNVDIHVPVWCDIVTKVILGGMVAVPGAFLCIARRLDFASSKQTTISKTRHTIFEALICIALPIVYMALHPLVQDRRFIIVHDFGCRAAIYNSLLALLLIRVPPFLLSLIAIIYCLSASWNIYRNHRNQTPLFPSAPLMTASLFIRRTVFVSLGMVYITTIYLYIITQTTQTSLDTIPPISQVRAHASEIGVPDLDPVSLVEIELVWWAIPILSLATCMLSALGEETRKGYKGIINWFSRRFVGRNVLPIHSKFGDASYGEPTTPIHLLRSGWDSELNTKSSFASLTTAPTIKKKPVSYISTADSVLPPSDPHRTGQTSPRSPVSPELEASFTESTLHYLETNTAKQLRLPSPPPTNLTHSPSPFGHNDTLSNFIGIEHPSLLIPPSHLTDVPEGASPATSIISTITWPEPPRQIPSPSSSTSPFQHEQPPSPSLSHPYSAANPVIITSDFEEDHARRAPSPAGTSVTEFLDAYAYLPHESDAPFSNIGPSVMNVPVRPVKEVQDLRRVGSATSVKKGIQRARSPLTVSKGHNHGQSSEGEVIYMTVVKETSDS